ncbi:MAG: molybdopterin/thiamine biosynthesis adenylyltransferase, partial [Bacteroidia bacterium]
MENRYHRQIQLPSFGQEKQDNLSKQKVLIVGCGGLGCPVAMYLSRAGVHSLGLVDADKVDITNLHRQVLFSEVDIGTFKVDAAKNALLSGNSQLTVDVFKERLNTQNYQSIISAYDIVVDGSDNFETRYLVNDACVLLNKPLVYGAANGIEGQVAVFNVNGSGNLRDLFPEIPNAGTIQNCEEAGVLGVTTGVIGGLMGLEVIKVITGLGKPLVNQLLQFDGITGRTYFVQYTKTENSVIEAIVPLIQ